MKHDFIDKHSTLDSVIHRLDPRVKILLCFGFLVLISSSSEIIKMIAYASIVCIAMILSRVPLHHYLKKLALVTPLLILLSLFIYISYVWGNSEHSTTFFLSRHHQVWEVLALLGLKIYLSVLVITLLVSCTRFNSLLWGLRKFRLPRIATTLSKLVYTYLFVFIDELHRTMRAYKSRTPVLRVSRVKVFGSIAGGILLRSIDRSEYIYRAMISRGFIGEFPEGDSNRMKAKDITVAVLFMSLLILVRVIVWKI